MQTVRFDEDRMDGHDGTRKMSMIPWREPTFSLSFHLSDLDRSLDNMLY